MGRADDKQNKRSQSRYNPYSKPNEMYALDWF